MACRAPHERGGPTRMPSSSRIVTACLVFVAALYVAWILAWLLANALMAHGEWLATSGGRTAYWTGMKLLLWVLPSVILIRYSGRSIRESVCGVSARSVLGWGVGAGLLIGVEVILRKCT